MKIKNLLITAMLLLGVSSASATITSGYYRIKSYNDNYMTEVQSGDPLICGNLNSDNYAQVWYMTVDGTGVTIRNAVTQKYIQNQTSTSASFMTGDSPFTFTYAEPSSDVYTFKSHNNEGLHCDGSLKVVLWDVTEEKSKWTIESVAVDGDELANQQAAMTEASTSQLTTFFTSEACTALKSTYQSMTDEALRTAMSELPATVQDMAIKVKNNSWTTYDGWDKTEKTFRIADYKAYSSGDRWTSIMGFGYHVGRIENPTGIYVVDGDYLQVYVGSIPAGESVKLAVAGYGAGGAGGDGGTSIVTFTLHEGMNTMRMANSGNCFVFYEVDNTKDGSAPYTALSNYADVTVHIEGGTVQGYFDLTKGDDDADWTPLKTHLMTKEMFCLKTKSLVFNLQTDLLKHAVDEAEGGSRGQVVGMLEYWQQIQDMEDEIFNREAIATFDYCNNIHSVTTIGNNGDGLLYAYTNGIYFSPEQHDRLFNYDLFRLGSDNLWAAAHELGHHRQAPINMVGNTEVSNNLYSNVAVYQQGRYTSRTASIQETFDDYADGISWPERVQRSCSSVGNYNQHLLHLNWQLYQFFHINGKKTDFFPRLFTALRANPMTKVAGADKVTPASTDYLLYYQKCCEASGYDLTEFFAAYGFFMLPPAQATPIDGQSYYQTIGDYSTYNLYVTQDMIDAALGAVAAMGLPKCNIIFIEDRVTAPDATYAGHAVGEKKSLNDACPVSAFGQVGEVGQYSNFDAVCSAYTYNVNTRGYVTMSGTGAVGFKLYNGSTLVNLYNTTTFRLPAEAYDAEGLVSGYTIKAAAGNGSESATSRDKSIEVQVDVKDVNAMTESATDGVTLGKQITAENGITSGNVYILKTGASRYITDMGTYYDVDDNSSRSASPTTSSTYQLIKDGEIWKIKNYFTGKYWGLPVYDTALAPAEEASAGDWSLNFSSNIAYPSAPDAGSTTRGIDRSYGKVWGWSTGTNDNHKVYIYEVSLSSTLLEEFIGKDITVANEPAATLQTGQWYVMYDRGANHGYLYENPTSHTLFNTSTAPNGYAPLNAQYLVRIVGENDQYYLQTGYGNYLGEFIDNTAVKTTALREHSATIKKINRTDGHYYLTSEAGIVLDANPYTSGNPTVVGWGSTVPTTTGGNNDWAFYPVTLPENNVLGFLSSDVQVIQGNQVTGKGNTMQALMRVKVSPFKACRLTHFNITLTGAEQLDNVAVYMTTQDQIRAAGVSPVKISGDITPASELNIPVTMDDMAAGTSVYFWITGDVKTTATEWETIDAAISSIAYTNDYIEANSLDHTVCDLTEKGNPEGAMRIYKTQVPLWTSSKTNPKYYRIPALLKTGANTLLAFTDDRHTSHGDLGNHRIDVLMKKSTDGGLTWGDAITVAAGDGSSAGAYGYGDAAVAQAANGDIVCLMAAGKASFPGGMLHIGYSKSTDGGETWSSVTELYGSANLTNPHDNIINSTFISSGHGITQSIANSGRIAFPMNARLDGGTINEYVIYSDDNGATWTITSNYGYTGADESKLLELNDGKLLMSIRTGGYNNSANRGYNRTTDTDVEHWGSQGQWSDLNANGCNSDLIYYTRSTEGNRDVMLHSVVKSYSNNHRKDLRLYMSFDQGETWKEAFQLQPGWAAYSSMQVLDNGDLAILFEDGSIGNEDENDCFEINYVVISSELMADKIEELVEDEEDEDPKANIKVVNGTNGEGVYGSWANSKTTWTSNSTSGCVGLQLTKSAGTFDKYSSFNNRYNLAYKTDAASTNRTLTLTAPKGYVITGYTLQAVNGSKDAYTYTLTAADGTTTVTTTSGSNSDYKTLTVTGLSASSTTITVNGTDASKYLAIANFSVDIIKSGKTVTDVKLTNNDATSYGSLSANVWTSGDASGASGLTLTSSDLTLSYQQAFSKQVIRLSVNGGNGKTGTLTITAPDGYLIWGYDIEAHNWSSSNSFTITPVEGTGEPQTVTNYLEGSTTSITATSINSNIAHLTITANAQTNPVCFRKFIVTLYNTEEKTVTYAIVDSEGNIATQVENVTSYLGYLPALPTGSIDKRPWCTYEEVFYKDPACTKPFKRVHSTTDMIYSRLIYDGPFEFSTEDSPKWYLLHSREQKSVNTDDKYYNADGTTFQSTTQTVVESLFDQTSYQWAFFGNPYSFKIVNRGTDKPIASTALSGPNNSNLSVAVTDENTHPYDRFTLFGYGGVLGVDDGVTNAFSLILKDSQYGFTEYSGVFKFFSSGVSINNDLGLTGYRTANVMAIEVPVTYDVKLNKVGDESYATLYLPYGVQTGANTRAFYITTVSGDNARLTELTDGEIPALTAAVLVNSEAETSVTLNVTSGLSPVVDEGDNLLKGVLVDTELDLGATTPNYSLGRKDGKIGFYKFNNGGTTTITLGANKAYLETAASGGAVKGFTLDFDDLATDINTVQGSGFKVQDSKIYNIAGQRLNKPMKGINIINGQKIVVK